MLKYYFDIIVVQSLESVNCNYVQYSNILPVNLQVIVNCACVQILEYIILTLAGREESLNPTAYIKYLQKLYIFLNEFGFESSRAVFSSSSRVLIEYRVYSARLE